MIKRLLLLVFITLSSSLTAQIKLNSSGMIAIGTDPTLTEKLRVEFSSGASTHTGIYVNSTNASGSILNYGIQGRASGSGYTNYGIYGYASGANYNWAGYFSGNVYTTGSYQSSDERLKKNIKPLDGKDILTKVLRLKPVRYEFLSEIELNQKGLPSLNAKEGEHLGLLAHEVEKIFPELITDVVNPLTNENGKPKTEVAFLTTKAINYQELTVLLLAVVQELQAEIEALKSSINQER